MKAIQCTGCGQVFWTDLQLDDNLVSSGEWVRNPCPKCGTEWAVVEPGAEAPKGRKGRPGRKRRVGGKRVVQVRGEKTPVKPEEGAPAFSASGIRKFRKKLGISQKKLASLVGVSPTTVVAWEGGKYKPRDGKARTLGTPFTFAVLMEKDVHGKTSEGLSKSFLFEILIQKSSSVWPAIRSVCQVDRAVRQAGVPREICYINSQRKAPNSSRSFPVRMAPPITASQFPCF